MKGKSYHEFLFPEVPEGQPFHLGKLFSLTGERGTVIPDGRAVLQEPLGNIAFYWYGRNQHTTRVKDKEEVAASTRVSI